jgi:hypothetical protein
VCVWGGGNNTHRGTPTHHVAHHISNFLGWKEENGKIYRSPPCSSVWRSFRVQVTFVSFSFPFFSFFFFFFVCESVNLEKKLHTSFWVLPRLLALLKWKRILEKKKKKSTTQVDTIGRGSLSSICVCVILFSSIFLQYIIKCSANLTPISTFFCVWPLEGLCAWARASVILFGRENRGDPGDIFSLVHPPYRMMMRVWTPFAFPSRDPSGATTFSIHRLCSINYNPPPKKY